MPAGSRRRRFPPCNQALDPLEALCQRAVGHQVGRSRTASNLRPIGHTTAGTPDLRRSRNTSTGYPSSGGVKALRPSAEHRRDDSFDMLAGAEPVDAAVAAAARIGPFSQTANFHLGAAAAHRLRTKRTQTGMAVFESFDRQFASTAPAPPRGFMVVASVAAGGEAGRSSFRLAPAGGISLGRWCRFGRVASAWEQVVA
jgi:hypothetical protein